MTPGERRQARVDQGLAQDIAAGAGVPVQEVNRLLSQFEQMQGMMKQMKKKAAWPR